MKGMKRLLVQMGICFSLFAFCLYSYLNEQNALTKLKMQLPQKEKEVVAIREEIQKLTYEADQFENPTNLIELAHRPEFCHLKHPVLKEILTVPEAFVAND